MCGIAGIAALDGRPIDVSALKPMCDEIAHRGPDDAGYVFFRTGNQSLGDGGSWSAFCDPQFRHVNENLPAYGGQYFHDIVRSTTFRVALGHRRLSILDLTHHGHQPLSSSDGRVWIAFNGEIYNFRELRAELEADGFQFRSRSDTEVIVHLWQRHGAAALEKLDGMFALAIYDRLDNRLTLARDRFGVKPVYYAAAGGMLAFASEIKAVLQSGVVAPEIAPAQLVEYMAFQNLFGRETLFRGIELLQPGELLTVEPGGGRAPRVERFHHGFGTADVRLNDPELAAERTAAAFAGAVNRQLVSDVPVGAYLSGGMDSGSIVALAGRSIPRLLTFTCGFDLTNVDGIEQGFDERRAAEKLSYLLKTEHYDVVLHSGDMPAAMDQITWHMDDPRVGMCHQNWYVAKLASRFVKVCLAGAGGDELFGGYPWRYLQGLDARTSEEFDDTYFRFWHRFLPADDLMKLFVPELRAYKDVPRERFDAVMRTVPPWQGDLDRIDNLLQRALHFELKTFMHGFLVTEDRISMAHSLETRVPFLDNSLADLAMSLPPSLKVDAHALLGRRSQKHLETPDGKRVLRRAMESFLPEEFTRQKKQGFSSPDANWYRGPSMDYIREVLSDRRTLSRSWFDQRFVRDRLEEHFQGRSNHRLLIWSLLSLEMLQRHYVDASARPAIRKIA